MNPITEESIYKHLTILSTGSVLINFTASWCGPCRQIKPSLVQLMSKYPKIRFYTLDIDELPNVADSQNINSVPTFQIWKNGVKIDEITGASLPKLISALNKC